MILDTIVAAIRARVAKAKERISLSELQQRLEEKEDFEHVPNRDAFAFEVALRKKGSMINPQKPIAFLCEVKKASPSKGLIAEEFPYLSIGKEYEAAGADAISVLTEPDYFQGADQFLSEIRKEVQVPVLRKDFTIDEYQIYEAKQIGADAILLIGSLLDTETLHKYLKTCDALGLSALVEAHTEAEIDSAIRAGARMIGVNNRNLSTFEVDIHRSLRLRTLVPEHIIYVAESGIRSREDILALTDAGVDAVLIGETLMRSTNKREELAKLRGY